MAYPKTRDEQTKTGHVQYVPAGWDIGPGEVIYSGSAQTAQSPVEPLDVPWHVIEAWSRVYRVRPRLIVRIPVEALDGTDS